MKLNQLVCAVAFMSSLSLLTVAEGASTTQATAAEPAASSKPQTETAKKTEQSTQDVGSSAKSAGVTIMTSIMPTVSTKLSSGSDTKKDKLVINAKNDAANYIASDGQAKGVYLESAIKQLRQNYPDTQRLSDLELAQAILAY